MNGSVSLNLASAPDGCDSACQTVLSFEPLPGGQRFKVLFVYPNDKHRRASLGLCVLSSCLKKIGAETSLCDTTGLPLEVQPDVLAARLKKEQPDLVGITALSHHWPQATALVNVCKELGIAHVVGGGQATECPEETIQIADMLVLGEGEGALLDIVRALARGTSVAGIPNVWVRQPDGQVIRTDRRPLIEHLDELPFPDWLLFHRMHYELLPGILPYPPRPDGKPEIRVGIESGRGCPYECTYCTNASRKRDYAGKGTWRREKSAARVIEEIKSFHEAFGELDRVSFCDDVFLTGQKRVAEFCAAYKEHIGLPFSIIDRPEMVTESKLKLAADAGLSDISFGFESGDEDFRRTVLNRGTPDRIVQRAFSLARKYDVRTFAYCMLGVPGQDERSMIRTWKGVRAVKPDRVTFVYYRPVPGTVLYEECLRKGLYDPACGPLSWNGRTLIKHDICDDDTIVRYHCMMTRYAARPGIRSSMAFHLGRRWNWACKMLLRSRNGQTTGAANE